MKELKLKKQVMKEALIVSSLTFLPKIRKNRKIRKNSKNKKNQKIRKTKK